MTHTWMPQKLLPSSKALYFIWILFTLTPLSLAQWAFTRQLYAATIRECSGKRCDKLYLETNERMGIPLPLDLPRPATISFRIVEDEQNLFKAETNIIGDFAFLSVRTKMKSDDIPKINREAVPFFLLEVRAKIKSLNETMETALTEIGVTIIDEDDASPIFHQEAYSFDVPIDTPLYATIGETVAADPDQGINAEIYYSFVDWVDEIAIHPTTGIIYVIQDLRNTRKDKIQVGIIAKNRGLVGKESFPVPVTFNIIERNQHSPVISWEPRSAVSSFVPDGITILVFKVTDQDTGVNGQVESVSVIAAKSPLVEDCKSRFTIKSVTTDPSTNDLYQLEAAEDITQLGDQVNITVLATDLGEPPKSSVEVIFLDIENYEEDARSKPVKLEIEETAIPGTPLYYISVPEGAYDITFMIRRDESHSFAVHPTSGVVSLKSAVDAEQSNYMMELEVQLLAKTEKAKKITVSYEFEVYILDENDNSPEYASTRELYLNEDAQVGNIVFIASASDNDAGENSKLTYAIIEGENQPFAIDHFSGEVTLTSLIDYDAGRHVYHVRVRASDQGIPFRRETEKIFRVEVNNVNDNAPMFLYADCNGYILENVEIGTRVTTMKAEDPDKDNIPITYSLVNTQYDALSIDSATGDVKLIEAVDNLIGRTLRAAVTASDGVHNARETEISVEVRRFRNEEPVQVSCSETNAKRIISDMRRNVTLLNPTHEEIMLPASSYLINSAAPRFVSETNLQYSLPEDLPIGSIATQITAVDDDAGFNGLIQYYIESGNSLGHFAVNGSTGAVIVFAPLDREANPVYTLTIVAQDMGEPPKRESLVLSLNIMDANDNPPMFERSVYKKLVNEGLNVGTEIFQIVADDRDEGPNGRVVYSLVTDTGMFSINRDSGRITVEGILDRETKDRHTIIIEASDQPERRETTLSSRATVILDIQDINDNVPTFLNERYQVKVREDMPIGMVIANVVARDSDLPKSGGDVQYKFVKGDYESFSIDPNTGIVRLKTALDFETKTQYVMTVRAKDNGTEPLRSTCELVVDVVDVNENYHQPKFNDRIVGAFVRENMPPSRIVQVKATDLDIAASDRTLTYSIRKGTGLGLFSIDNHGWINTTVSLDREAAPFYWITVYVQDQAAVPLSSSVEVFIDVGDKNDNAPETEQAIYYLNVLESSPPDMEILTIHATDKDSTSDISYSITGGNSQSLFAINPVTGVITTTQRILNRESDDKHLLDVTISDGGDDPLTTNVQVWVTVDDVNDNPPRFFRTLAKFHIDVLSTHNFSHPVFRPLVSDPDEGENGKFMFDFVMPVSNWRIDQFTGYIYMVGRWDDSSPIELTEGESMHVLVQATDQGDPRLSSSVDIVFNMITAQRSEIAPYFYDPYIQVLIRENHAVFDLVALAGAEDPDSARLYFHIEDGAMDEGEPMFWIHPSDGSVKVAQRLDYERREEYLLNISVTDGYHIAFCQMTIQIEDVNEHPPKFSQRLYETSVPESSAVGADVLTVSATDGDKQVDLAYLIYSATNNMSFSLFDIDHTTGVISVIAPLDHETTDLHKLVIKVMEDDGNTIYSDYANVVIRVTDHNDHAPLFPSEELNVRVVELQAVDSLVTQIQAIDKDKGINAEISYAIISGNVGYTFNIDPDLGLITLARELDISVRSSYELTVMASDNGSPPLSSECLVRIQVTVADERPPTFVSTSFTAELMENEPIGSFVIALSGESQSTLTYNIVDEGSDASFSVNPNSGMLTTDRLFDYEERKLYVVVISATDIIGNSVSLTVTVHIMDANDNRPTFRQEVYYGMVSEGAPDGSVLLNLESIPLILRALDLDSNLNALLHYTIIEPEARQYFDIVANTGALKTRVTPNREIKARYVFHVQVHDQGEDSLSAATPAKAVIDIIDINDTPPQFTLSVYNSILLVPTYKDIVITRVRALDIDSNSEIEYEITEGDDEANFAVNETSGFVYVVSPDGLRNDYELTIKATDGIHDVYCTVKIIVKQPQTSNILFSSDLYAGEVQENTSSIQSVIMIRPLNIDLGEPVSFELLNELQTFMIGTTSGVISTTADSVIDRETRSRYDLIVRVHVPSDGLTQVQVVVNVTDINDNQPVFLQEPYYSVVSVEAPKGHSVAKVEVIDKDVRMNSEIRFSLLADGDGHFRINKKSGEVFLRQPFRATDANDEHTLVIQASDQGTPSLSSQTNMMVKVITATTPQFKQTFYEASVPENLPVNSAVASIEASSPSNNKLIFSISDGDPEYDFSVNYNTGTLRVNSELDYERNSTYRLKIRATDVVTGDWADALVIITIDDVNDQKPEFSQLDYYKLISEAVTVGSEVITLMASDRDTGINGQIHYTLKPIDKDSLDHTKFAVKNLNGKATIVTAGVLDHEMISKLDFIIVATDGGNPRLSTEAFIHVSLIDLNDNPPVFEGARYHVEIMDSAAKGQFAALVAAIDADKSNEGLLMYSIVDGNVGQAFAVNSETGAVYVSPYHEPTQFNEAYFLNVSVTDGIYTAFTSLTIEVKPANRHVPKFARMIYNFPVSEGEDFEDLVVGTVEAFDDDQGDYGTLEYSIIGDSVREYFRIQSSTGELSLKKPLDRETTEFYMIPTMAKDGGAKTHFTSVYITVEDINDNAPQFTATGFNCAVQLNTSVNVSVLTLTAFDLDKDENAHLTYSMLSTDRYVLNTFMITPTGDLKLRRLLTADDNGRIVTFFVKVQDGGIPSLDSSASITVTVTQLHVPHFLNRNVTKYVKEEAELGELVVEVKAEYWGDSELAYKTVAGPDVRTNALSTFGINSEGHISVLQTLDAEEIQHYHITIEAYTKSTPNLVGTMLMSVTLIDTNDNPPKFTSDFYNTEIAEDASIGSTVLQVSATDIDQDHNTKIKYSFAPESVGLRNVFMVDPNHGYITTLAELDREKQATYEFYVQASDEDYRSALSSQVMVVIDIIDVNDSPPQFMAPQVIDGVTYWNETAAINEDAESGSIVIKMETTDNDTDEHAANMFYISGGNDLGHFRIKSSGEILVVKHLDRELVPDYQLQVSATDGVFVETITVQVIVLDANDNPPICQSAVKTAVIAEDRKPGNLIMKLEATDADDPDSPNSKLSYRLEGDNSEDFAIDEIRGTIWVHERLDRETVEKYHLRGIAEDGGGSQCVTDILITVTDINDNSPQFENSVYIHTLPEDSINNTLLLRLTAKDDDTGFSRKVRYGIRSGADGTFLIDELTGVVRMIRLVDRLQKDTYSMVITATDMGDPPRIGTARLNVRVADVNDPPVFERRLYNATISEATATDTSLLSVKAESMDDGPNGLLTYRITDSGTSEPLFEINAKTGELKTVGLFDYELVKEYVLTVEARDAGETPLSDTCVVTIYVTDYNDNAPVFSQMTYSATIREDANLGDHVRTVLAQDADSGVNKELTYSIINGDELNQFTIDPSSGDITVADYLDREAISRYTLTIRAVDKGVKDGRQRTTVNVVIDILDINDNPPVFSMANYTAQVQVYPEGGLYKNTTFDLSRQLGDAGSRNMTTNASIPVQEDGHAFDLQPLRLAVTDTDAAPNNGPFNYEILLGNEDGKFTIRPDGLLVAEGVFDLKLKNHYQLKVQVDDGGIPALTATTYVDIQVRPATLHPPQVVSPRNFTVVTYESMFPGGEIGFIVAHDLDGDPLTYNIVNNKFSSSISVDTYTGSIKSFKLDEGLYKLNVSASDGRFTKFGIVQVNVIAITEEMMSQAVGLSMDGITDTEFISTYKQSYERAIQLTSNRIRKVTILSVTETSGGNEPRARRQVAPRSLVVLVAAQFHSGALLEKRQLAALIKDNKNMILSVIGGLDFTLTMDGYACSPDTQCRPDERCELGYRISADKITIHSQQQSFVSLVTVPRDTCVCEDENCVNPCLSNPCPHDKVCVPDLYPQSHSCRCPTGMFGADCDLHDGSPIAFNGNSFTRWSLVNSIKKELNLMLSFRTIQADAILMDARGEQDYSTLEIVNGKLQYSFECGSGPAIMKTLPKVNDGQWHSVHLERNGNIAKLLLDNLYTATAEGSRDREIINLRDNNVHFGAIVKQFSTRDNHLQGAFTGCMKDIKIRNTRLPYTDENSVAGNFTYHAIKFKCSAEFYGACSINPCVNNGVCEETIAGAICSCRGYDGPRCEHDLDECAVGNPCAQGSECLNTVGSYQCICSVGQAGRHCELKDECLNSPCLNAGVCENVDRNTSELGYSCQCSNGWIGPQCARNVLEIIYIVGGVLALLLIIGVIIVIIMCIKCRRKKRDMSMPHSKSRSLDNNSGDFYSRDGKASTSHDLYDRAPSLIPPSVPPRPASYTPSQNDLLNTKHHDLANDYGSAAEGLNRLTDYRGNTRTTTFQPLAPTPPSPTLPGPIKKPTWQFGTSGSGGSKPEEVPLMERHGATSRGNGTPNRSAQASKAPSVTNGSFISIPQEDEGYNWDTSDWIMKEDGTSINQRDGIYPHHQAARLLSMSEVDDSEYVGDSEFDDDAIPPISEPAGYAKDIAALQDQYKLDYDVPEINIPRNRNHYLPAHPSQTEPQSRRTPEAQALLAPHIAGTSPVVPQRMASLSYSTEDVTCLEETSAIGGYTSMEGDSQSETDDDNIICEIETDPETDEDYARILSRMKEEKQSSV